MSPDRTTRRHFLFGTSLVFGSTALGLSLGELLLRVWRPQRGFGALPSDDLSILRYSDDPYLGWELIPGIRDHNASGYRGRLIETVRNNGVWRIAILGDSVTYGLGLSEGESYPSILEKQLNAGGHGPAEVLNFGVPGYSTFQELTLLRQRVLAYRPDTVILAFSTDDVETSPVVIKVDGEPVLFRNQFERHWWLNNEMHWALLRRSHLYRLAYQTLVVRSLAQGKDFSSVFVDVRVALQNVIAIREACVSHGIAFGMAFSPLIPPYPGSNAGTAGREPTEMDAVRTWAKNLGVPSVDFALIYDAGGATLKLNALDMNILTRSRRQPWQSCFCQ